MGCPTGLVTAVAVVITSPGALLTLTPKMAPFLHFLSASGVNAIRKLPLALYGATFQLLEGTLVS